jgi:hypothetical protein
MCYGITVQAYQKRGLPISAGMEISFLVKDAGKWEVEPERTAAGFDAGYYWELLEKARDEVAFVLNGAIQLMSRYALLRLVAKLGDSYE